jgi:hypothetical protein
MLMAHNMGILSFSSKEMVFLCIVVPLSWSMALVLWLSHSVIMPWRWYSWLAECKFQPLRAYYYRIKCLLNCIQGGGQNNWNTKKLKSRICVGYIERTSVGNTERSFVCLHSILPVSVR